MMQNGSGRASKRRKLGVKFASVTPSEHTDTSQRVTPSQSVALQDRVANACNEPVAPKSALLRNTCRVGKVDLNIEPVIEQWYADPYERFDPDGPTSDNLRRTNLENALRNRGFSIHRTTLIANWLLLCNGRYREFMAKKCVRTKKVSLRQKSKINEQGPNDRMQLPTPDRDFEDNDNDAASNKSIGEQVLGFGDDTEGVQPPDEELSDGELLKEAKEIEKLLDLGMDAEQSADEQAVGIPTPPEFTQEHWREDRLRRLRRSLHVFDIVYGDQLPEPNPKIVYTYSDPNVLPCAVIPGGVHSQGHHPLQEVNLPNGCNVLTEDPTLGIIQISKKQQMTSAERNLYDEQVQRAKARRNARRIEKYSPWIAAALLQEFSSGYCETWKGFQKAETKIATVGTMTETEPIDE